MLDDRVGVLDRPAVTVTRASAQIRHSLQRAAFYSMETSELDSSSGATIVRTQAPSMSSPLKERARAVIDQLPDSASWDDLLYQLEVVADIERGLQDSAAGRVTDTRTLKRELGIDDD
jgi:hypothetical protein